jgi:hypothetical protein
MAIKRTEFGLDAAQRWERSEICLDQATIDQYSLATAFDKNRRAENGDGRLRF